MRTSRLAAALVTVLAVAGCAGGAPVEPGPTTLRVAYLRDAPTWDPIKSPTGSDDPLIYLVYDRLIGIDAEAEIKPELATAWEVTPEGLLLDLRGGVRFADGTPFDASVVKANLDRARELPDSGVRSDLAAVRGVEVIDADTVLVQTDGLDVTLPGVLASRAGAMVNPAKFGQPSLDQEPDGTGPFRMVTRQPGSSAVLERNPDYWAPDLPGVDRLELSVIEDDTGRVNAVRSGAVDVALISPTQIGQVEGVPDVEVVARQTLAVTGIQINPDLVPAAKDVRVRQALNYGLDRQAIIDGVLGGQGIRTVQAFPPDYWAFDDSKADAYPYDPDRARQLLAEAGYPEGFEMAVIVGTNPTPLEVQAVQAQWAEIGVRVTLEGSVGNQGVQRFWSAKTAQALAMPWSGRTDPALTYQQLFLPEGNRNPGGLSSPEVIDLIDRQRGQTDASVRSETLRAISGATVDTPLSVVWLYSPYVVWATTDRVRGFEIPLSNGVQFKNVRVE